MYNLKDEVVVDKLSGTLDQQLLNSTFESYLKLDGEHTNHFKVGESYYAIGSTENGSPVRSETVVCKVASPHPVFEGNLTLPEPGKGGNPAPLAGGDMMIQFTNFSSTTFSLSTHGANLQKGLGGLTTAPGPYLQTISGMQSMSANQVLAGIEHGDSGIFLPMRCR